MKIAFREESTIDYPGEYGVILFTPGCNFRCGFCHNAELIGDVDNNIDLDFILKEISVRARGGWYTAVCISGGEPCLQPGLLSFVEKLKEIGLKVKINTNGTYPSVLKSLLDAGVDYVAMDIKASPEKYKSIVRVDSFDMAKVEESINLVVQFPKYDFRTTVLPFYSKEDVVRMGKWVSGIVGGLGGGGEKVKKWVLQQFRPDAVKDEEYNKMKPTSKEKMEEFGEVLRSYAEEVEVLV
jgi:pyruvate formate lyase activating enzyme